MKSYATFVVIALMSVGLVFLLATRPQTNHEAPAESLPAASVDAGGDAAALDAGADGGALGHPASPAEKPLRITSLGWELVAPGVALTPPAGASAAASTTFELAPESTLDAVEVRLARGGADPQGADIALVPLPAFVASIDRLRALEPRAFLVVGFSHGREEFHAAPSSLNKAFPGSDEVKLVGLGPTTASEPAARASGSDSATLVGLFGLSWLGVPPSRVRVVAPGSPEAKAAPFAAVVRGAADERPRAFSTADAARLVPIVAVAPKGLLDTRTNAVRAWATAWFDGLARTKADVPGVARRLAAKDALPLSQGVGDAETALVLVERLGQIEDVALADEGAFFDASAAALPPAKREVTLEKLTQRTWRLARGGGFTSSPTPEPLPIDARIASLVAPTPKVVDSGTSPSDADAGAFGVVSSGAVTTIVYRATEADAAEVASELSFLAAVFDRAVFKISAKGGDKTAKAIANDVRDRGVAQKRLVTSAAEPQGAFAVVDVLSSP
jgi:hypothetical protein